MNFEKLPNSKVSKFVLLYFIFICSFEGHRITLPNHYAQMDTNYSKTTYWTRFYVCTNGYVFNFFCNYFSAVQKFHLKSIQLWQLTMISNLVVKWNVIVNYHILIIHNWSAYSFINFCSNWQIFARCLACYMKWIAIPNTLFKKSMYISVIFW